MPKPVSVLGVLLVAAVLCVAIHASGEEQPAKECEVTYDNFGKGFLDTYCLQCHVSTKKGFARRGAPKGLDWDDISAIAKEAGEMVEEVEEGKMPPKDPKPSAGEIAKFKSWLKCQYE